MPPSFTDNPFVQRRRERWNRLSSLLDQVSKRGLKGLSGDEALELGRLYRQATSDLAFARTHFPDDTALRPLNELVARGHGVLYVPERGGWNALVRFYLHDFPEVLHQRRVFVFAATGLFLLGILLALARPDLGHFAVSEAYNTPSISAEASPATAGFITQNNVGVAFMAFAGGITCGLLTAFVLLNNGLMLGAVGLLIERKGQSAGFWPSIAPHGALELTAIMLAGGAGLLLGWTLLHPGDLPRGRALSLAAQDAVRLIAGTLPMFIVAGTIEGFLSFSTMPPALKLAVSALSVAAMALYFTRKPDAA